MKFSKIKDNDIANGLGITMSLWTQGCPHHCRGCFNPETWNYTDGNEFTDSDLEYIINNIDKNNIKRDLSILGGEPLCPPNIDKVLELVITFKQTYPLKSIYLWTGYVVEDFNDKQKEVLKYTDILVDGKFEEHNRDLTLTLRGSSNQRVINVKETLKQNEIILYTNI